MHALTFGPLTIHLLERAAHETSARTERTERTERPDAWETHHYHDGAYTARRRTMLERIVIALTGKVA